MNSRHRAIRALIQKMSLERLTDYMTAFGLSEKEKTCIVEKDVLDLSYTQICQKHNFSPDTVKETRRRAYAKIADGIAYREEKGRG